MAFAVPRAILMYMCLIENLECFTSHVYLTLPLRMILSECRMMFGKKKISDVMSLRDNAGSK